MCAGGLCVPLGEEALPAEVLQQRLVRPADPALHQVRHQLARARSQQHAIAPVAACMPAPTHTHHSHIRPAATSPLRTRPDAKPAPRSMHARVWCSLTD